MCLLVEGFLKQTSTVNSSARWFQISYAKLSLKNFFLFALELLIPNISVYIFTLEHDIKFFNIGDFLLVEQTSRKKEPILEFVTDK